MKHALGIVIPLVVVAAPALAQTVPVTGRVLDTKDQAPLIGANVLLTRLAADSARTGAAVEPTGAFTVPGVAPGRYRLTVSFLGYQTIKRALTVDAEPVDLGTLSLAAGGVTLKGVEVTGQAAAAVQKGDTAQYNARAFKTNPDANAQDLITKMPGVTVDPSTGKVQAQGEQVQRILVDGKEFFGNDPDAVLKNLPAEAIDKIQVYDRASDQAQFTGFDDGNQQKTINIVTKPSFRNGQFGRVLAGVGRGGDNQTRYRASGNINSFRGKQRFSVIAQTNNVNEQNFGTDDLLGVVGNSARGGGGGRNGGGGNQGGGNAGNFLVGQSGGISQTNAVGLNYSDSWGTKTDVQASYFFNRSQNTLSSLTDRRFTAVDSAGQALRYNENSLTTSTNTNHRVNLRLEHKLDSLNSFIWQPRLSVQLNESNNSLDGATYRGAPNSENIGVLRSDNRSLYAADNTGINFGQSLLFRHRFRKRGRTFSLGANMGYNTRDAENTLNSLNTDYTREDSNGQPLPPRVTRTDQRSYLDQTGWQWSANANYTEPLSPKSQLQVTYNVNYTPNDSDKRTNNLDPLTDRYDVFNEALSNVFTSRYLTNAGGLSYRYNNREFQWSVGAQAQHAQLRNEQEYPLPASTRRNFFTLLPNAQLRYNFSRQQNLRLNYQMRTQAPSISQLQEVVNNSNPLQVTTGNPDLRQENTHNVFLRFSSANVEKSTSFFALVGGSYTNNNITNSTRIFTTATEFVPGVVIPAGGQLTRPVNLDGQYTLRSFANYTLPVRPLKSNLNLNLNANFARTPGLVTVNRDLGQQLNYSRTPSFGLGVVLSSNISPNLDFTLSSNSSQTYVRNTLQTTADRQYFRQSTNLRFSWIVVKGLTVQSDVAHVAYNGLSAGFNQNFVLWNASVGKKIFARQQGEIKLYAFDLLKQNNSIQPNQTAAYVEDVRTNILTRYVMLMFTYNIRNFPGTKGGAPDLDQPQPEERRGRFGRPDGSPGGPPGGFPGGGPPGGGPY